MQAEIIGQRFSRLLVSSYGVCHLKKHKDKRRKSGHSNLSKRKWLCNCDCGLNVLIAEESLKSGNTKSCGCLKVETAAKQMTTHGLKSHPLYSTWQTMKQRCYNKNTESYGNYGERGIEVYTEWRTCFESYVNYIETNLGCNPSSGYTLDRIDNNKGYFPGNLQWASKKAQQRNRRSNRILTYKGESKCLAAWAEERGISATVILTRLNKLGWSIEKAITTPVIEKFSNK